MMDNLEILDINAANVEQTSFFCLKSRPKAPGYRRKLDWLQARFAEGLRMKILRQGKRLHGFIEYFPGEYSWRAVDAAGYLVIQCLWVVGKAKSLGYGVRLLQACLEDARAHGLNGVVMVASDGPWLASKKFFINNGFDLVDQAPPAFDLLVRRLSPAPLPAFPTDWDARLASAGPGLTVQTSGQCPYLEAVEQSFEKVARQRGLLFNYVNLEDSLQARRQAFSPYGVFGVALNGRLLTYHWEAESHLNHMLDQ